MTRLLENTTVRLFELLVPGEYFIQDLHLRNVTLLGPALMYLHGVVSLRGETRFQNDLTDIIWEIPEGQQSFVGAIALINPIFEDCIIEGIGIAATHDAITALLGRTHIGQSGDDH